MYNQNVGAHNVHYSTNILKTNHTPHHLLGIKLEIRIARITEILMRHTIGYPRDGSLGDSDQIHVTQWQDLSKKSDGP